MAAAHFRHECSSSPDGSDNPGAGRYLINPHAQRSTFKTFHWPVLGPVPVLRCFSPLHLRRLFQHPPSSLSVMADSQPTQRSNAVAHYTSSKPGRSDSDKDVSSVDSNTDASDQQVPTSFGVKRMEAVARAGKRRPVLWWTLWTALLVCAWGYTLQGSTTYNFEPLATSRPV